MRFLLTVLLLFTIGLKSMGQTYDSAYTLVPRHVVKVLPSGLIDPFHQVFALSYERINPSRFAWQLEVAYLKRRNPINPMGVSDGFLVRPSLKYYIEPTNYNEFRYVEIQPFFKHQLGEYTGWITKNCHDRNLQYERFEKVTYSKSAGGLNVLVGYMMMFELWKCIGVLDLYLGGGVRYRTYSSDEINGQNCISRWDNGITGLQKGWYPNMQIGIKLGLGFGRSRFSPSS